jgi:hypothetical protein
MLIGVFAITEAEAAAIDTVFQQHDAERRGRCRALWTQNQLTVKLLACSAKPGVRVANCVAPPAALPLLS